MNNSKWIWYPGDYEIYHSIQLHSRRQEYGFDYPSMWGLSNVYPRVNFEKTVTFEHDGWMILHVNGIGYVEVDRIDKPDVDGKRCPCGVRIPVEAGEHRIFAVIMNPKGLPAIFCESDQLATDSSWLCSPGTVMMDAHAGDNPAYTSPTDNVEVFPFSYTPLAPVSVTQTAKGTLYDFGRESFGPVSFNADPADTVTVVYGETPEEASAYEEGSHDHALLYEIVSGSAQYTLRPRAFRYIMMIGKAENVSAQLELLPETYKASFSCDRPDVEKIFKVCAYTFHLNSREFLLDGIKRDRWCWSGDAYQSYLVNDYLFADRALNRRTITALYGKPPILEHVNRINDYSALLLIGTWEYYFTTGDLDFIRGLWGRIRTLYDFIVSRLDEDGQVVARPGDWIFIDWSEIDKSGPLAAEQILLWQACRALSWMADALGKDGSEYLARADRLKTLIMERYWNEEKFAFIDTYTSGRNHVTRHAAIFAILYDFVDADTAHKLVHSVLENDAITQITTPYFKLFELMALCKLGCVEGAQDMIDSYWGGMLALGATSIWEQYIPQETGTEHYAMYGKSFGRSLCHAWGSGPILLLGRYVAGVRPTSVGSKTFTVEPKPGRYSRFDAAVPVSDGIVRVKYDAGRLSVTADIAGGTLIWNGKEYPLEAGTTLEI